MIVADIVGALGNQLFSYAATKSIALDLGYEYRYRVIPFGCPIGTKPSYNHEGSYIDKHGQEYNEYFEKAFHIDTAERIDEVPMVISSEWTWNRFASTNFSKGVYEISDETHLSGYFLHPKYFERRRAEVLQWFCFQEEYLGKCRAKLNNIVHSKGATHLVSVHIRCGKAYRLARMVLDTSYHRKAIQRIRAEFPRENLCFVLFSDCPEEARHLLRNEDVIINSGTMFEDLCSMSLCDSHIVANSTFSWWGAWLSDQTTGIVIRPSKYPDSIKGTFAPLDIFPTDWIAVEARQERLSPKIFMQRIRDEYSPMAVRGADNPVFFERFFIRPFAPFRRLLKQLLPIILVDKMKSLRRLIMSRYSIVHENRKRKY